MTSGAVSLWVAGDEQAERAAALVRELGHTVTVARRRRIASACAMTRFDPSGPLRGALRPPADKSISHRAALIAAMGEGETTIEGYLDAADTRSTLAAVEALGRGEVAAARGASGHGAAERRRRLAADRAASACAAPRSGGDRRRQRRHPAAPAAGLARRAGRRRAGRSTATTRSAAGRSTGSPRRCARWAPTLSCREERLPPLRDRGRAAARHRRTSCRSPAPRSSPACSSPGCWPRARPASSSRCRAATTASGCWPPPGPSVDAATGERPVVDRAPGRAARAGRDRRPRRLLLRRLLRRRGAARRRQRRGPRRTSASTRPAPACSAILERMGAEIEVEPQGERGGEPIGDLRVRAGRSCAPPRSAAPRCRWRSTSCRWSRSPPASPRGRRRSATPPSCAARSPTGSPPSADGAAARSAARSRRPRTGWSIEGSGGLRGGAIDSHGDHRIAMLGAVAGLASREGVEVARHGRRRGQLPRLRGRSRLAAAPRRRLTGPRRRWPS